MAILLNLVKSKSLSGISGFSIPAIVPGLVRSHSVSHITLSLLKYGRSISCLTWMEPRMHHVGFTVLFDFVNLFWVIHECCSYRLIKKGKGSFYIAQYPVLGPLKVLYTCCPP